MEVHHYTMFINRLKYLDIIKDQAEKVDYTENINQLKQGDTTDNDVSSMILEMQESMDRKATVIGSIEKVRPLILIDLLKTDITLELQLFELQDIAQNMDRKQIPLTDDSLKRMEL